MGTKRKIELVAFGGDGFNVLFEGDEQIVEVRTIKDMNRIFRDRTFADCEGTDFWNLTEEEEKLLMENSTLDEVGTLGE